VSQVQPAIHVLTIDRVKKQGDYRPKSLAQIGVTLLLVTPMTASNILLLLD
jgi:hypothetical protein